MNKEQYFDVMLTPLEPYFFGGEKSFFKEEGSKESQQFFVKSNRYPQQTAVVGMLRHLLLDQNNFLPLSNENAEQAGALIGKSSFDMASPQNTDLGIIKSISPVFIQKHGEWFRPIDKGHSFNIIPFKTGNHSTVYHLDNYDAKKGFDDALLSKSEKILDANGVFKPINKIGIQKKGAQDKGNEGFYKQQFIQMAPGFSFVFRLTVTETGTFAINESVNGKVSIQLKDVVFTLGAERTPFSINFKSVSSAEYLSNLYFPPSQKRIILLSDAVLDPELLTSCDFVAADLIDFRQLTTSVSHTRNFSARTQRADTINRQVTKWNLLQRGGILFCSTPDLQAKVESALSNHPASKIGYNSFYSIN